MHLRSWIGAALSAALAAAASGSEAPPRETVIQAMERATAFMRSISTNGGYVGLLSLDTGERWGESGKQAVKPGQIWIQPPGTPTVGEAYLAAWNATGRKPFLEAARETGRALAWTQRKAGGWEYLIDATGLQPDTVDFPKQEGRCTFDDDTSQSAIRFLMHLHQALDEPWLDQAVELGLRFLLDSQADNGGFPQWSPPAGGYHDYYTFNDGAMNDIIDTLLEAWQLYRREELLNAVKRAGDFIVLSQLPAPQAGWAQQYDLDLKPAWARAFEPPGLSSNATSGNIKTLVRIYQATEDAKYLDPIPAAIDWLERSKIGDKLWARLYELETNRPIYGDRDNKVHYTLEEISEERRTGYSWQSSYGIPGAIEFYKRAREIGLEAKDPQLPAVLDTPKARQKRADSLASKAAAAIGALDGQGRWLREQKLPKGDGTIHKFIASGDFVANMRLLAEYADLTKPE